MKYYFLPSHQLKQYLMIVALIIRLQELLILIILWLLQFLHTIWLSQLQVIVSFLVNFGQRYNRLVDKLHAELYIDLELFFHSCRYLLDAVNSDDAD